MTNVAMNSDAWTVMPKKPFALCEVFKTQMEQPNAGGNRFALPSAFCQQLDMQMIVSHKPKFPVAFVAVAKCR